MKPLILALVAGAALSAAEKNQTFVGTITDEMCTGKEGHSRMRMGPTDAECTLACVDAHGAAYVLDTGKTVYMLTDQRTPETFAGRKVRVVGVLERGSKTIRVVSMTAVK